MRVKETSVYQFGELSDTAKEKAREWWRGASNGDNYFAESVIESASNIAEKYIGIDLKTHAVKLMNGNTRYDPAIWWSGFSYQGDGASYEGRYTFKKGGLKALRKEWPTEQELDRIVVGLYKIQRRYNWAAAVDIGRSGSNYAHSRTMDFNDVGERELSAEDFQEVCQLLRDFADWIYDQLKAEYEYQMSDEVVDETIQANEYEFDEEGRRA